MNIKKETLLLLLFLCVILLPLCVMFGYNLAKSRYSHSDLDGISGCVRADTVSATTSSTHHAPIAESEKPVGFDTVYLPSTSSLSSSAHSSIAPSFVDAQYHVYRGSASAPSPITVDATRKDSPRIVIPITQKVYRDSDYTAYVSGYRQNLDSITVRSRVTTITRTVVHRPRLNFGITLGAGYGVLNKKPDVFIGIGATYRLTK